MGTAIKIDGQWIPIMQYAEWLKDAKRQGERQEIAFNGPSIVTTQSSATVN